MIAASLDLTHSHAMDRYCISDDTANYSQKCLCSHLAYSQRNVYGRGVASDYFIYVVLSSTRFLDSASHNKISVNTCK